jgi:hypothetical protein
MMGHSMNKVLKNAATIIILTLFNILILEVAVRIWGYSEKDIYDNIYTRYEVSEEILFIHKSNLINASGRNRIPISTDDKGLRIAIPGEVGGPKKDNEFRIAIIGDSITFGEGVKAEDTFCMVIERILNKL